jgi:hypothetical protein
MQQKTLSMASIVLAAVAGASAVPLPLSAQQLSLPCASTRITRIVMPTAMARVAAGRMTLANGAILELSGDPKGPDMYRISEMRKGDRVVACYGPLTTYADAGPSRTITILNLRNGGYYGTLIGTW